MKLRRIISALVVFTVVMTCAVCSVSAAGTYHATTSYDIGTGNVTVNASISGATPGSTVKFGLYKNATTMANGKAAYSKTGTVGEDGSLTFEAVTYTYDDFTKYAPLIHFTSDTDELSPYEEGSRPFTYTHSVEQITDFVKSVTFLGNGAGTGGVITVSYVKDGDIVTSGTINKTISSSHWAENSVLPAAKMSTNFAGQQVPANADAVIFDWAVKANREGSPTFSIVKSQTSFDGVRVETAASSDAATALYTDPASENLMINGRYKDNMTDGEIAGFDFGGGTAFELMGSSIAGTKTLYMTVDSAPVIGTYLDIDGVEHQSVTFLATASGVAPENAGLRIFAYPKGTFSNDATVPAEQDVIEIGDFRNQALDGAYSNKFGIELVDTAGTWNFNNYDFEAVPIYWEEGSSDPIMLSVLGDREESMDKYYTVDRLTVIAE